MPALRPLALGITGAAPAIISHPVLPLASQQALWPMPMDHIHHWKTL